jgi:sec-independent protein translocase protein TatA
MTLGALELLLVLSIVLLLIGPRRIAAMGRSLGRGIRDFKTEFSKQDKKEALSGEEDKEKPPRKG